MSYVWGKQGRDKGIGESFAFGACAEKSGAGVLVQKKRDDGGGQESILYHGFERKIQYIKTTTEKQS